MAYFPAANRPQTDMWGTKGKFRDEFLNRELFDTVLETQVLADRYRKHYNSVRPHSALGYRPPAPEAIRPRAAGRERVAAYQGLT